MKSVLIDETGNRYGRLTVVSRAENTKRGLARWNCVCDCGNTTVVIGNNLRNGNTVSCGCRVKEVLTVPTMPKNQFYMKKVRENEAGKA